MSKTTGTKGDEGGHADLETHGQRRHCLRLPGACLRRCIQLSLPLLRATNGLTLVDICHDPVNGLRYQASNGHRGDQDSLIKHFTSAGALAKGHCGASVVVGRRFACQLPGRISGTVFADPSSIFHLVHFIRNIMVIRVLAARRRGLDVSRVADSSYH